MGETAPMGHQDTARYRAEFEPRRVVGSGRKSTIEDRPRNLNQSSNAWLWIGHNLRQQAALPNGSNPARIRVISMTTPQRAEIFALPALRPPALSPFRRLCYLLFGKRSVGKIVPLTSPSPIR